MKSLKTAIAATLLGSILLSFNAWGKQVEQQVTILALPDPFDNMVDGRPQPLVFQPDPMPVASGYTKRWKITVHKAAGCAIPVYAYHRPDQQGRFVYRVGNNDEEFNSVAEVTTYLKQDSSLDYCGNKTPRAL